MIDDNSLELQIMSDVQQLSKEFGRWACDDLLHSSRFAKERAVWGKLDLILRREVYDQNPAEFSFRNMPELKKMIDDQALPLLLVVAHDSVKTGSVSQSFETQEMKADFVKKAQYLTGVLKSMKTIASKHANNVTFANWRRENPTIPTFVYKF